VKEKAARNEPCFCGSGKKYKNCCLGFEEGGSGYSYAGNSFTITANVEDGSEEKPGSEIEAQIRKRIKEENLHGSLDKGIELMEKSDLVKAEKIFKRSLEEYEDVNLRNNLAAVYFYQNRFNRCLEILKPALQAEDPENSGNTFSWALASRAYSHLEKQEEAYQCLEHAELLLERELELLRKKIPEEKLHGIKEYTVILMKAAADLKDHLRVMEIYDNWKEVHQSWENAYLAAVACFNLGFNHRAALLWTGISEDNVIAGSFARLPGLVEEGVVPFTNLSYYYPPVEMVKENFDKILRQESYLREALNDSVFGYILISMVFDPRVDEEMGRELLSKIVVYGASFGRDLGERIIASTTVSREFKMAAAEGLLQRGLLSPNDCIPILVSGENRLMKVRALLALEEADPETAKAMDRAQLLKQEGRPKEAIEILKKVCDSYRVYPPAALELANLLRREERLKEAENYLRMVEEVWPEHPPLWVSYSALMLETGNLREAQRYLISLEEWKDNKEDKVEPELQESIESLQKDVGKEVYKNIQTIKSKRLKNLTEEKKREKIEEKPVNIEASLSSCLKNAPADWLTGLCKILDIKPADYKKERRKQLLHYLESPDILRKLVEKKLGTREKELLAFLLYKKGWARMGIVSRKFGSLKGQGFNFGKKLPEAPLGVLWALGLVAVGKTWLKESYTKIVVIPVELREPLASILEVEYRPKTKTGKLFD